MLFGSYGCGFNCSRADWRAAGQFLLAGGLAMVGVGPMELVIVAVLGLVCVAMPIAAVVIVVVMLNKKKPPE